MAYNQDDGTGRYNKSERGGWYCTNPKKHDDNNAHHAAGHSHDHHAERNDQSPNRRENEPSRYERGPRKVEPRKQPRPSSPLFPTLPEIPPVQNPQGKKGCGNNGCGCIIFIVMAILFKLLSIALKG